MVVEAVPEGKYVDVCDDVTLHLHDTGSGEKGTVMFLHGSGPGASGWSNFKGNYPALNEAGYRTLVPDLFGYGYSSKPEEGKYFMGDLAAQFLGMLDKLGVDKVSLVGNSMGGAIAVRFALDYPERVEKLILMAPGGIEERDVYMEMVGIKTMIGNIIKNKGVHTRQSMRETFKLQLFDESQITDQIIEERIQVAETQPKGLLSRLIVKNQEDELKNLTQPVLCLWGANDKFCPASGAVKVAQQCPNAYTIVLSKCGHWLMVEHEDFFNRTVAKFLDGEQL